MDTNIAQKIARAFVHGLAFAKGMATLAQDAKAKMEEGDKWITIGAEPGDDGKKHGGRHVLISGTGEVKAGLSKSAQGKPLGEAIKDLKDKAENKPETHTYSAKELDSMKQKQEGRVKAKKQNAELNRKFKEGEKASTEQANQMTNDDKKALKQIKDLVPKIGPVFHQAKSDLEFYSPSEKRGILKEVRFPDAKVTENIKYLNELEGYVKKEKEVRALAKDLDAAIKAGKLTPEDRNIYVRNLKYGFDELTKGIQRGAHALYDYAERANRGGYVSTLDDQWIREAVRQARGGLSHITWTADKLKASQRSTSSETEPVKAKKQNAELNRKFKEGVESGNIRFPRNEFRERAKAYTEQASQVINDDLKPSVDKLGSAIRKDTDNARMPQSTLDDLNDIHNLAKQIGPMANKLNKYNEKYAAEHDDPSNYVISNYGAATKGTAERAASLARRAAAMSNQLTAPDDERDYSEGRAKQEIRDILNEMQGLHGDLLKKTRHAATAFNTSKPSNSESDRVDAMYAQKGSKPKQRIIN